MQPPLPPRTLDIHEAAPAPAPAPGHGEALAQLGAWRTRAKAEETLRAARLAADPATPPPIRVVAATVRGQGWWRVVAGPMRTDEAAALCLRVTPCWVRQVDDPAHRESP